MTFRLLRAVFDPTPITVELGTASVEKATDLMLMALADQPTAAARIEYQLALPDESRLSVAEGQPVRLAEPLTGNVTVAAKISGTAQFSPVLYPGVQLVSGATRISADYVSRAILGGKSSRVRVISDSRLASWTPLYLLTRA